MSLTFQPLGSMLCAADCCLRFAKRTRAGSSGSSRLWCVTLGGERVSRDGALSVIIVVNVGASAKEG